MPRERIIEGTWDCGSCGQQKILARHKQCPGCGNPREEGKETDFDFGERSASGGLVRESATDAHALETASVGPDWFCAYCQTANRADATRCRNCAADRAEGTAAVAQTLLDEPPAPPEPAYVGYTTKPPVQTPSWLKKGLLGCVGITGLMVLGTCVFGYWLSRTGEYTARVSHVSWSRQVTRQTFAQVTRSGWKNELRQASSIMPVAGSGERPGVESIRDCRRAQRGTRQVADGTREVCQNRTRRVACGTEERCHVVKQGNGFAKEVCDDVTKYCSESYRDCHTETRYRAEPVFDIQCAYNTWDWTNVGEAKAQGTDDPPQWPALSAGKLDRLQRQEQYRVVFEYRKGGKTESLEIKPSSESEFLSWRPGQEATAVVTNGGELKELKRR